jgi:hypothetical protein
MGRSRSARIEVIMKNKLIETMGVPRKLGDERAAHYREFPAMMREGVAGPVS